MAKSQIIKDLANSKVDLATALKRTKLLLSEIGEKPLLDWVDHELVGYNSVDEIPEYRVHQGILKGTFVIPTGLGGYEQHTNVNISLNQMPKDDRDRILNMYFYDGVSALKSCYENSDTGSSFIEKPILAEYYPYIQKHSNYSNMRIINARVLIDSSVVFNVLSIIENKLLDTLLLLEKEFGCLDELDIDTSSVNSYDKERIAEQINLIIFDKSVHIGNDNKIKNTNIN